MTAFFVQHNQKLEQQFEFPLLLNIETGLFDHDVSMSQSGCGIELIKLNDMTYEPIIQFQEFWNSNAKCISTNLGIYKRDGKKVIYTPRIGKFYGHSIYFIVDPYSV